MQIVKRILAVAVMVVSILVLVLSLAGVAGTWILRARVHTAVVDIVTGAEARAANVQQGLDQLDTALTQANDQVAVVEQEVLALGADLDQNQPLLTTISDKLGLDLAPLVDKAREIMGTIRETAAAVNSIVETVNTLPFISKPIPELAALNELSQKVEAFETDVQNLRTTLDQRRSEIIGGAVSLVTTPASQIRGTLDEMRVTVSGYSQRIGTVQEGLSRFRSAIGGWLTWGAAILTLILLWLALSQGALFVLGWRAFSGQDLLPRKRHES
jgi:phage-related protein